MSRTRMLVFTSALAMLLALVSVAPVFSQGDSLLIWADGERAPLLEELGAEFEAEFGVAVEVQELGLGDARDDLLNFGPVGEGPDVMIIPHDSVGLLVDNGAINPIDISGLEDQFDPLALNLFTYDDGELYAVPYATENIALIRNVDLVPEAPATWQEVRAVSEELIESGQSQYGFVIQTGNTYHNFPVFSAFGGYIFGRTDDGAYDPADVGVDSEGSLEAAQWLSDMYTDGLMPTDVTDDVVFELFTSGDAAMFVTGPWFSSRISETGVNYSIDPLPGAEDGLETGAPFLGGQGFVISAFSDNQLLAETFVLDFIATTDFMQAIFDNGGRPSAWLEVDQSANENIAGFVNAGEFSVPMPNIPEMGAVWSSFDNALTLVSQGEPPIPTFQTAEEQIVIAIDVLQTGALNSVTIAGDFQEELGCETGDWQPGCEVTFLEDMGDGIWQATFTIPAGEWQYKAALNADWAEAYPADNVILSLSEETEVTFTFDRSDNSIVDSVNEG